MTAEPNAKIHNLPIITSERLREVYAGQWENMSVEDIIKNFGELYTVDWKYDFYNFKLPEGESIPELAERIYNELKDISEKNEGKTILVTMHAAAIRSLWGKIQPKGVELPDRFPLNASYTLVKYEGGELLPIEYSVGNHLSDVK
jgi:broad specificity phosphatase PhoE